MDKKIISHLDEAKKSLLACERLFYVGLTILKDNRILTRTIGELAKSLISTIRAYILLEQKKEIMQIGLSEELKLFFKKIAPKYLSHEDKIKLIKLLTVARIHKNSDMEFVKKDRLVMCYNGKYEAINKESILEYSRTIRRLITLFPSEKA